MRSMQASMAQVQAFRRGGGGGDGGGVNSKRKYKETNMSKSKRKVKIIVIGSTDRSPGWLIARRSGESKNELMN